MLPYMRLFAPPFAQRPPPHHPPTLTVSAFLFRQRRRAAGDVRMLAGDVVGDEHAPVGLGHGGDGREKGEWRRGVQLLFRHVVILGGVALVQHPGARVGERRVLGAAPLLLGEGGGRADAAGA